MVIAIDIRPLLESEQTGVSVYTKELIDELVKNKNHQFILFYNSWGKEISDVWRKEHVKLRRFGLPNKLFNALQTIFRENYFDDLIPEADYFLFPNLNFWSLRQKPYGVVIHDISFERYGEFFNFKSRLWHQAIDVPEKLHSARDIFAVSAYTVSDVADFYKIKNEKIKIAHPGLPAKAEINLSKPTNPYFLFLGRIEERKNVLAIIEAFIKLKTQKKCAEYTLVLAGPMVKNTKYTKKISKIIAGRTDINFIGFTTDNQKNNLLGLAVALIYPSFYEGFGFPPLEAQRCGVPVVASNTSSMPEIISNSGILIDPDRVDDIVWAMDEVANNEATRKMLIARGLENVKRFNWSQTAKIIESVINSKS